MKIILNLLRSSSLFQSKVKMIKLCAWLPVQYFCTGWSPGGSWHSSPVKIHSLCLNSTQTFALSPPDGLNLSSNFQGLLPLVLQPVPHHLPNNSQAPLWRSSSPLLRSHPAGCFESAPRIPVTCRIQQGPARPIFHTFWLKHGRPWCIIHTTRQMCWRWQLTRW